jgi:predicted PurR-regulated permease PerM
MSPTDRVVTTGLAVLLLAGASIVFVPLWAPLAVAVWTAALLAPVARRIGRLAGDRPMVGAAACVIIVFALFVPVGILAVSLVRSGIAFATELTRTPEARKALELVVESSEEQGIERFIEVLQTHGATAWQLARDFAGAGAWALIVVMTFSVALFQFLVAGKDSWRWLVDHAPLPPEMAERLGRAFLETGRGIFVGAGLTALAQALIATVTYVILGVPRAAVLGALTFVCAFVPAVGTAVVWIPVAAGLALSGQTGKAAALAVVGLVGIGSIDNVLRPFLQRWGGHIDLPAWLLLVAAFGGLAAFGPAGLLLGPLVLRLSKEVLVIGRERRLAEGTKA